jgi:hypothetical protein
MTEKCQEITRSAWITDYAKTGTGHLRTENCRIKTLDEKRRQINKRGGGRKVFLGAFFFHYRHITINYLNYFNNKHFSE